jgi:predicted nucleic acid-binding protein
MRKSVVFDTNILVYFFDGNYGAAELLANTEYFLSAISHVEISGDLKTLPQKRLLIKDFLLATTIIHTNAHICDIAAKFRLTYAIKLPDAIIAATARYLGFPLVTAAAAFLKIKEIE